LRTRALSLQVLVLPRTPWPTAATGARPATKPKGAVSALVGGGDRRLLHNLILDLVSSLMIFFALSGSSNGTLPLFQLQLRPWLVTLRGRLVAPTLPGLLVGTRAILTVMPVDSRRNTTQPGTNWRSSPNRSGLLSSSGSTNASSCSRPSMVSPATCSIST
jgi:hypothetical protein